MSEYVKKKKEKKIALQNLSNFVDGYSARICWINQNNWNRAVLLLESALDLNPFFLFREVQNDMQCIIIAQPVFTQEPVLARALMLN